MARAGQAVVMVGVVVALVLYACAWVAAKSSIGTWLTSEYETSPQLITAASVSEQVAYGLKTMWLWVLFMLIMLAVIDVTIITALRPGNAPKGRWGRAIEITMGSLKNPRVLMPMFVTFFITYVFAWVSTQRALVGVGGNVTNKRAAVEAAVEATLTFNLAMVVVVAFTCTVKIGM